MQLDHEKLDVYIVSLDFTKWAYQISRGLKGIDRNARDQLLRASHSIALNIAEGCGKMSLDDRSRFFQIASGSARECAAAIDILNGCGALDCETASEGKQLLVRVVCMLTKMIGRSSMVQESRAKYGEVCETYSCSTKRLLYAL